MRADGRITAVCFLGLCFAAGLTAARAEPVRPVSPLDKLESVQGAASVQKTGQVLVVTLPSQDGHGRWFRVEAGSEGASSFPAGFRAAEAQVHYWKGHLVLIADGKAWHFSVPGADRFLSDAAQVPDAADLVQGHDLKEIHVSAIYSASGPRAARLNDGLRNVFANTDDQQDIGNGLGSCGTTCSITCGDGSTCSATCGGNRCARCSCPASCSCS